MTFETLHETIRESEAALQRVSQAAVMVSATHESTLAELANANQMIASLQQSYDEVSAQIAVLVETNEALTNENARLLRLLNSSHRELPSMLIGTAKPSASPSPKFDLARHYFQLGDFGGTNQPTWEREAFLVEAYAQGARTFSLSFKDKVSAAKGLNFLDSAPDDVTILGTFFHEHEGNIRDGEFDVAWYQDGCYIVADWLHQGNQFFGPIHNGVNRVDGKWVVGGWADTEAPLEVCDFWGTDRYAPKYQDPRVDWQPILAYAKDIEKPILIGECGAPADDPAAQLRYIQLVRGLVLNPDNNFVGAMYWDNQFSGKPDWRFANDTNRAEWFRLTK